MEIFRSELINAYIHENEKQEEARPYQIFECKKLRLYLHGVCKFSIAALGLRTL